MADLTTAQKAKIRQRLALNASPTWTKPQVGAAIDALTARLDGSKAVLNADIEAAAPGVFNVAQKLVILEIAVGLWAANEGAG